MQAFPSRKPDRPFLDANKWAHHRLRGRASTLSSDFPAQNEMKLGEVIAAAKRQIASAAGVPAEAVHITLDLP
jgi:hypothetical protein